MAQDKIEVKNITEFKKVFLTKKIDCNGFDRYMAIGIK
jgi:hypothetical protein